MTETGCGTGAPGGARAGRLAAADVMLCLVTACGLGETRPNLVIVLMDALRPDRLGCYGYGRDPIPSDAQAVQEGDGDSGDRRDASRASTPEMAGTPTPVTATVSLEFSALGEERSRWTEA